MQFSQRLTIVALAAVLIVGMAGCAKSATTGATPAPPQPSDVIAKITVGIAVGEAVVPLMPNMSASVKAEVEAGLGDFSTGLACASQAIAAGATGTQLAIKGTACLTGINISNFSPQAQTYLSAADAGIRVLLALFAPTAPPPVVTVSDVKQAPALQARAAAVAKAVGK